jgi:hypothetical protein
MTRKRKDIGSQKAKSQRELARRLSVSRSTIDRLCRDGLKSDSVGHYDVEEAREFQRVRTLRLATVGKKPSEAALASKERKLAADASMAELKYAQARGELILRDQVQQEWRCALIALKNRFLGLGRELGPRLTGCGPMQIQAAIDGRIFEILRMLANPNYYPIERLEQDLKPTQGNSPLINGGHV